MGCEVEQIYRERAVIPAWRPFQRNCRLPFVWQKAFNPIILNADDCRRRGRTGGGGASAIRKG
jgi:hypothetical protein